MLVLQARTGPMGKFIQTGPAPAAPRYVSSQIDAMVTHTPGQQETSVSTSANLPHGSLSQVTTPPAGANFHLGRDKPEGGINNSNGCDTVNTPTNDPASANIKNQLDSLD